MTREEFQRQVTPRMKELFAESSYPWVERFMAYDDDEISDPDARFDKGLQLLLDGVAFRRGTHQADSSPH